MRHGGWQPNVIFLNALASGCVKGQQRQRALGSLLEMRHSFLRRTPILSCSGQRLRGGSGVAASARFLGGVAAQWLGAGCGLLLGAYQRLRGGSRVAACARRAGCGAASASQPSAILFQREDQPLRKEPETLRLRVTTNRALKSAPKPRRLRVTTHRAFCYAPG